MNDALRGDAFHEAGHAVAARHFEVMVTTVEIYEDGGGKTYTEGSTDDLSHTDRIAIAYAGLASQNFFKCSIRANVAAADHAAISKVVAGLTDQQSFETRNAGYLRAFEIVKNNAVEVERVASLLIERRRIDGSEL
jgi:ATP-dependent Zn protease